MAKHVKGLSWLVFLFMVLGLILIFASVHFGVARGNSWLMRQTEGSSTEIYYMIIEAYTTSFMMIGGILFGTGLLIGILTFFTAVLFDETEEKGSAEVRLKESEET